MRRIILCAAIGWTCAGSPASYAQTYDEGVAPTQPAQDAEAAQFENRPDQPPQSRPPIPQPQNSSAGLSGGDLQQSNARGRELERMLEEIEGHLREADRLLAEVAAGSYIVETFGTRTPMTPAQIDRLRRSEDDNPLVVTGLAPADGLLRDRSNEIAAELRVRRQEWWTERDQILRELDQIRRSVMADADRPVGAGDGGNARFCGLPHVWRNEMQGRVSTWAVDEAGAASEALENDTLLPPATGQASLEGNRLTIRFAFTVTGGSGAAQVARRYLISLDAACNGAGSMVVDSAPPDLSWVGQSLNAAFTSLGGQ